MSRKAVGKKYQLHVSSTCMGHPSLFGNEVTPISCCPHALIDLCLSAGILNLISWHALPYFALRLVLQNCSTGAMRVSLESRTQCVHLYNLRPFAICIAGRELTDKSQPGCASFYARLASVRPIWSSVEPRGGAGNCSSAKLRPPYDKERFVTASANICMCVSYS